MTTNYFFVTFCFVSFMLFWEGLCALCTCNWFVLNENSILIRLYLINDYRNHEYVFTMFFVGIVWRKICLSGWHHIRGENNPFFIRRKIFHKKILPRNIYQTTLSLSIVSYAKQLVEMSPLNTIYGQLNSLLLLRRNFRSFLTFPSWQLFLLQINQLIALKIIVHHRI